MDSYDGTQTGVQGSGQYDDFDPPGSYGQYPTGYGQYPGSYGQYPGSYGQYPGGHGYPYMPYNPYFHHFPYFPFFPYYPYWYYPMHHGQGGYPTPYGHEGYGGERADDDERLVYWGFSPFGGFHHHFFFPFFTPFGFGIGFPFI